MSDNDPFEVLDKDIRAYALVGYYLGHFALLENKIEKIIQSALKLDPLAGSITTKNINYRNKINILNSMTRFLFEKRTTIDGYRNQLNKIAKISEERRTVAHEPFMASIKNNGVEFLVTRASGEFKQPLTDWSIQDFHRKVDRINKYFEWLDVLGDAFEKSHVWEKIFAEQKEINEKNLHDVLTDNYNDP